jgi:hypothetical protein
MRERRNKLPRTMRDMREKSKPNYTTPVIHPTGIRNYGTGETG